MPLTYRLLARLSRLGGRAVRACGGVCRGLRWVASDVPLRPPVVASDDPEAAIGAARRLADEVLWPAAQEIDGAPTVPKEMLDALASAGLYGLVGPSEAGGLAAGPAATGAVIGLLGGASLSTAFVWVQHHTAVRAVAESHARLRAEWLPAMCTGAVRSGIAVAALRRPGPPAMVAEMAGRGLLLRGFAPWVTGWGLIDVVLVAARDGDDIVWVLMDADVVPGVEVERLALAAVDSSSTVRLRVGGLQIPASRIVGREPYAAWQVRDSAGLGRNGFLAIGVAERCIRLLGEQAGDLASVVDQARRGLHDTEIGEVIAARVAASLVAVRAAMALVAAGGGRSVGAGDPAQRLAREAMFLLVFAQTDAIRRAQLRALTTIDPP